MSDCHEEKKLLRTNVELMTIPPVYSQALKTHQWKSGQWKVPWTVAKLDGFIHLVLSDAWLSASWAVAVIRTRNLLASFGPAMIMPMRSLYLSSLRP